MQDTGKVLKMDVFSREIKMDSLDHLVHSLDRLSKIMKINNLKNSVRLTDVIEDVVTLDKMVRVSKMALTGHKICWLYRETPVNKNDTGWRMHHGEEGDDYIEDNTNFVTISVAELISQDGAMEDIIHSPVGSQFEWFDEFDKFVELD